MDLVAWWQARRWAGLLELIDQLPAPSRFNEAVLNDVEVARELVARENGDADSPEWSPKLSEFDLHAILLRDVIQALHGVQAAVIAGAGGKPPSISPYPSPKTALDEIRQQALQEWVDDLISRLTPHAVR